MGGIPVHGELGNLSITVLYCKSAVVRAYSMAWYAVYYPLEINLS